MVSLASTDGRHQSRPVNLNSYLRSVRTRYLISLVLVYLELAISLGHLGYRIGAGNSVQFHTASTVYLVVPVLYLLLVDLKSRILHLTLFVLVLSPTFLVASPWNITLSTILVLVTITSPTGPGERILSPDEDIKLNGIEEVEDESDEANVSPVVSASLLSLLLFHWVSPLLRRSMRATLNSQSLPYAPPSLRCPPLKSNVTFPSSPHQLFILIFKTHRLAFFVQLLGGITKAFLTFIPAWSLSKLIRCLEEKKQDEAVTWCLALGLVSLVNGWSSSQISFWEHVRISNAINIQLRSLLFQKALRRKEVSDDQSGGQSQILNLFTVDVGKLSAFSSSATSVVVALIDLIIGTTLLWSLLGWSALSGILLNTLLLPMNSLLASTTFAIDVAHSKSRDVRVGAVDEALTGIRQIKFAAWEDFFEKRIGALREEEVRWQRKRYHVGTIYNLVWGSLPILSLLITFAIYTKVQGGILTPSKAFPALAIFNGLNGVWTTFPNASIKMIETGVSLRRLARYFGSAETPVSKPESQPPPQLGLHEVISSYTSLDATVSKFQLHASLHIPKGKFTLICGGVGSGKTLLLQTLLKETQVSAGEVLFPTSTYNSLDSHETLSDSNWINCSCAYVPQTYWLRQDTIRNNILFGLPFHRSRYQAVLEACALLPDLQIFSHGDEEEIGERGITLSGGQKARVQLARAIYSRAEYLVMDDTLSAVDAHVGVHLLKALKNQNLMAGRTRVLVSHHVSMVLPSVDTVISLKDGQVEYQGAPGAFKLSSAFNQLIHDEEEDSKEESHQDNGTNDQEVVDEATSLNGPAPPSASETETKKPSNKLLTEEVSVEGRISAETYKLFFTACGGVLYWLTFAFTYGSTQILDLAEAFWLRQWTDASGQESPSHSLDYYLLFYALITFFNVLGSGLRWVVLYEGVTTRASAAIHKGLLHNVLRANLRWFDSTAHGTLMNRFSGDVERVDGWLPDDFGRVVMYSLTLLSSLAVVGTVAPVFLIAVAALTPVFVIIGIAYSKIVRDLRRLDSVSFSPLISLWAEVINDGGSIVIRAFGATNMFLRTMASRIDSQTNRAFHGFVVYLWLTTSFSTLNSFLVGFASLSLVRAGDKIDAALAGFTLTFALNVSSGMLDLMLRYVSFELSMVGVERIKEFSEPQDVPAAIIEPRPPAYWPAAGHIQVENLTVRYAPHLPDVLHDVSFEIKPGEKIGVVGKTGSGKSTLALSFFRFIEATSGKVKIDGFDISNIGTKDLRSRLSIIPQDPVILSGTLRSALDLEDEFEDAELYQVLRQVNLLTVGDSVNNTLFSNLSSPVSQHGSNFSQGQRQLLCIARALLRRSKFMILDEASSSIDLETDSLITQTMREAFQESSLLVIAHRLRTVIEFDRILVLKNGRILEFDTPKNLLENPSSSFYSLCESTGRSEFAQLKKLAKVSL